MLLSAIGACSADSGVEPATTPEDATTIQSSLIQPGIPLGAPYHPNQGVISSALDERCIDHDTEVIDASDQRFKAAYIFEARDVALKLESLLNEELDTSLDPSLLRAATQAVTGPGLILPDSPQRMVLLAVRVNTVSRRVVLRDDSGTAYCDVAQGNPGIAGNKFINRCGTQYLAQEDLGGYLFVGLNLTRANREQVQSIHEQLLVGLNQREGLIPDALSVIASQLGPNAPLKVVPWGVQGGPEGIIPATDWPLHMARFIETYQAALRNGDLTATTYGATIGQRFDYYTGQQLSACGVPYQEQDAFACFNNMFSGTYNPRYPGPLEAIEVELDWLLQHEADRIVWDDFEGPHGESAREMAEQVLGSIRLCRIDTVEVHRGLGPYEEACVRSLTIPGPVQPDPRGPSYTWEENVCQTCQIPVPSCQVPAILARYNELPSYRILNPIPELPPLPMANEVAQTYWKGASSSTEILHKLDSHLCVWSGLKGKMAGAGEEARVYPDLSSDEWKMRVRSGQSGNGTIHAGAICTLKDNFWDSKTPTAWTTPLNYEAKAQSGSPDTVMLGLNQFFSTLSGIKGRMRGTGEQATVTQRAPASELRAQSHQGTLHAWATTVGTLMPQGGEHRFLRLPDPDNDQSTVQAVNITTKKNSTPTSRDTEYVEYKLAPADEALCYLTKVSGKFDGGGERVRLEQRDGYWFIKANAGCDNWGSNASANRKHCSDWKQVVAQTRCVAYNQR